MLVKREIVNFFRLKKIKNEKKSKKNWNENQKRMNVGMENVLCIKWIIIMWFVLLWIN